MAISSEHYSTSQPLSSAPILAQRITTKYGVQISTAEPMFAFESLGLGGLCDKGLRGLPDFTYEVIRPATHHHRSGGHMVQD